MSHLLRSVRLNHLFRGFSMPSRGRILNLPESASFVGSAGLQYRLAQTDSSNPKNKQYSKADEPEVPIIRFRTYDAKKIFKQFYSVYGPLFVVCHISVSLTSLGIFSTIVWLNIDPLAYVPDSLGAMIGDTALKMTGSGGKFVIAYAIHKLILPFRLILSIGLTKLLSSKIKFLRKRTLDKTS